jgi:NTE family protein
MTGLIMGLEQNGVNVRTPRAVIGTSAGSVVGAQMASSLSTQELFDRQVTPEKQARQDAPDPKNLAAAFALFQKDWESHEERLRTICELALVAKTISWRERRAAVIERLGLPSMEWPTTPLTTTAVDVETRELRTFDAGSGESIVDAVAASCAVPGVWPVAEIGGRRYIDGGIWRNGENAHLAAGSAHILILAPFGRQPFGRRTAGSSLQDDVARLRDSGAQVTVISADQASLAAMGSGGALDPASRAPGAVAGLKQGHQEAAALANELTRA